LDVSFCSMLENCQQSLEFLAVMEWALNTVRDLSGYIQHFSTYSFVQNWKVGG